MTEKESLLVSKIKQSEKDMVDEVKTEAESEIIKRQAQDILNKDKEIVALKRENERIRSERYNEFEMLKRENERIRRESLDYQNSIQLIRSESNSEIQQLKRELKDYQYATTRLEDQYNYLSNGVINLLKKLGEEVKDLT